MINGRLQLLAAVVSGLAVGAVAIIFANHWSLSVLLTLSIGCWLAGVLYAVYAPRNRRPMALAALVCSFLYLLLVGGPWFETHVGPWLLTTRALVAIDHHLLGRERPSMTLQLAPTTTWGYTMGSLNAVYTIPQTATAWQPADFPISPGVSVGQWLLGWCAAGIGALAVGWLRRRAAAPETSKTAAQAEATP